MLSRCGFMDTNLGRSAWSAQRAHLEAAPACIFAFRIHRGRIIVKG